MITDMPCYDERCKDCGITFEAIVLSFSAARPCPECGSEDTEQMVSIPHFRTAPRKHEIKRGAAHNPYAGLTLQHVRGEDGKPITVNSERELHEAEKRHGFVHAASWGMEKEPPQHEKWAGDLTHGYEKKWARDPAAYTRPDASKGVSTGVAANANETLAGRPGPL
jgi:putative FmdB family regulatory protein